MPVLRLYHSVCRTNKKMSYLESMAQEVWNTYGLVKVVERDEVFEVYGPRLEGFSSSDENDSDGFVTKTASDLEAFRSQLRKFPHRDLSASDDYETFLSRAMTLGDPWTRLTRLFLEERKKKEQLRDDLYLERARDIFHYIIYT